jgi:hypothetical protein
MRGELCRRQVLSFTCCVFCGEFENNVEHLFSCTIARVVWCLLRMLVFEVVIGGCFMVYLVFQE